MTVETPASTRNAVLVVVIMSCKCRHSFALAQNRRLSSEAGSIWYWVPHLSLYVLVPFYHRMEVFILYKNASSGKSVGATGLPELRKRRNRSGKSHYFKGFQVSCDVSRSAFWS